LRLRIHRDLGPGLLESVYEAVMAASLLRAGLAVERQKPIAIEFDGMVFREAFEQTSWWWKVNCSSK
jgi:iron complex transport system substrate-binding protein